MPDDLRPGPDSPPTDELKSAEATFGVLQQVLHGIAKDDESKQTPCKEFDVAKLTDHLMNSITAIGGVAGAEFPERDRSDSVERQVVLAARPALDAWHRRGLDGTVSFGGGEAPAKMMAGILSLEFLVHAWDYAAATGREVTAPDSLSDFVLGLAHNIITPQGRTTAGFDDPVEVAADARALERLIAYTGRTPV
ncbi:TIGR03086 family metal-binding protein [Mycobacterium sp.]|uniref:TIGR03086 family metal-binding protein n=1 Tax=Mycobacterium sp. TaxID=1785 RepID=UPI002DACD065|nr:TIGR03086 family metal-binding protein [Mycobacterium sp.]